MNSEYNGLISSSHANELLGKLYNIINFFFCLLWREINLMVSELLSSEMFSKVYK